MAKSTLGVRPGRRPPRRARQALLDQPVSSTGDEDDEIGAGSSVS